MHRLLRFQVVMAKNDRKLFDRYHRDLYEAVLEAEFGRKLDEAEISAMETFFDKALSFGCVPDYEDVEKLVKTPAKRR